MLFFCFHDTPSASAGVAVSDRAERHGRRRDQRGGAARRPTPRPLRDPPPRDDDDDAPTASHHAIEGADLERPAGTTTTTTTISVVETMGMSRMRALYTAAHGRPPPKGHTAKKLRGELSKLDPEAVAMLLAIDAGDEETNAPATAATARKSPKKTTAPPVAPGVLEDGRVASGRTASGLGGGTGTGRRPAWKSGWATAAPVLMKPPPPPLVKDDDDDEEEEEEDRAKPATATASEGRRRRRRVLAPAESASASEEPRGGGGGDDVRTDSDDSLVNDGVESADGEGGGSRTSGGASSGNKVRSIRWSPYDRVRVVNADP